MGNPDPERICMSIVERSNLSTRLIARSGGRVPNRDHGGDGVVRLA